jgi:outer membrane lipoprotein SlyB
MRKITVGTTCTLMALLGAGCQSMGMNGPEYGATSGGPVAGASSYERQGRIADIVGVRLNEDYHLGIGTVVGAVAGGLLGHQIGGGSGNTLATIAGTVAGGAAGTAAEQRMKGKPAQRVTVDMRAGGTVTVVQPPNDRLWKGMPVVVVGSGESARVVPRS